MNIKIQGGGSGQYANKGSSTGIVYYLQHEDWARAAEGNPVEPFFNNDYDKISSKEVIYQIDHNKERLCKSDAKFFVITVSPSQDELKRMGKTPQERALALKEYIRNDIMQQYAENFNRNFNKEDIMYYSKIHHNRGDKPGLHMHAHIIVSRKDMSNTKKLSPQTNHKDSSRSGNVKSGFNRTIFYKDCECYFDKRFEYHRPIEQTFEYCNAMKNGSIQDIQKYVVKSIQVQRTLKDQTKEKNMERNKTQEKGGAEL